MVVDHPKWNDWIQLAKNFYACGSLLHVNLSSEAKLQFSMLPDRP